MDTRLEKEYMKGGEFLITDQTAAEVFTPEDFTDEHRMIGDTCRQYIDNEVVPNLPKLEGHEWEVARELLQKAGELGLLGANIPEELGGMALDQTSGCIIAEMVGRGSGFGSTYGAQTSIGLLPILYWGSEELKNEWVPKIISGEVVSAYCLTESGSGSDCGLRTEQTQLEPDPPSTPSSSRTPPTPNTTSPAFISVAALWSQGNRHPASFPEHGPLCLACRRPSTFGRVSSSNTNGNARRPFYRCTHCDKWVTWADMRAVGPGVLTGWQAQILHELYARTLKHLTAPGSQPAAARANRTQLAERLQGAVKEEVDAQAVKAHVAMVSDRYLAGTSVQRMADHLRLLRRLESGPLATELFHHPDLGSSDLVVVTRDVPGLFSLIAGTLAASNGTLERSEQFWSALEPLKDEIILRLTQDFALDGSAIMTLFGTMDAYAEAHLLRKAMFLRLTELGGPVTDKGKARGLLKTYLAAMDRELKLAQTLGFERKAKSLNPLDAVRAAVAEANKS